MNFDNDGTPPEDVPETIDAFLQLLKRKREDLTSETLFASEGSDQDRQAQVAALDAKIANPEQAYAEHKQRADQIEDLLKDVATQQALGENRIRSALAGFADLKYEEIDALLAETEERAILTAANAAYGRGLVAEDAIKWHDAYRHYKRAAELYGTFDNLQKSARIRVAFWSVAPGTISWREAFGFCRERVNQGTCNRFERTCDDSVCNWSI